jgi:secretin/TonB-like protein
VRRHEDQKRATSAAPFSCSRRQLLSVATFALLASPTIRASRANKRPFDIKAGSAIITLAEFVRQTGLQVLFESDAIRNHSTREVRGQFEAAEALGLMLEGSGLTYEFVNERTVTVRPRPVVTRPAGKTDGPAGSLTVRRI